jgi:tetratricopeptide (TPR) repeat protein
MPIDTQLNDELKALIDQQRYDQAIARCEQALATERDDADLLTVLANCEVEAGQRERAIAHLHEAAALDPQHAASRFHLGRLLIGEDRMEDAREHLTQCLVLDPNHAGARTILARIKAAKGQFEDAMTGARTALRANPDHVPALVLMAELELEQGNPEAANEQASRAVRLEPANSAAQLVMAKVMEARGHLDFARQNLENAIQAAPAAIAPQLALAEFHDRQQQPEQAVAPLRAALAIQADRQDLRLALARSLRRAGRLDEALAEYQWLLDDGTPPPALVVEGAECLAQAGRSLEARSQLDQHSLSDRDDARFLLARLDLAEGQSQSAREALEALTASTQSSIAESARVLLSRIGVERGDHESVLADLEREAEQGEIAPERLWQAAGIANEAGLTDQEMRWLSALLEHHRTPEALRQRARPRLADLCDRAADYDRAAQLLRSGGWRTPFGLAEDAEEIVRMALAAPNQGRADSAVDDGRPSPLVILGWPGSGRETLLAALDASEQCQLLDQEQWPRRREALLQVLDKLDEGAPDEAVQQLARRRYLRGLIRDGAESALPVETGVLFAPELIALKRAFPDAAIIRIRADLDDLGLYWQLAGFSDVDTMKSAWDEDQLQLDRLLEAWGEEVIEVKMADCVPLELAALSPIQDALPIVATSEMVAAGNAVIEAFGLRPAGHSRHYAGA